MSVIVATIASDVLVYLAISSWNYIVVVVVVIITAGCLCVQDCTTVGVVVVVLVMSGIFCCECQVISGWDMLYLVAGMSHHHVVCVGQC